MSLARVFFPQDALEAWMAESRAHVVGETLILEGQPFVLESALRFVDEVAGGGDETKLVGRVKSLEQVIALGGEHHRDSVVLGDNAYQVVEGYLASPELGKEPLPPGSHKRFTKLFQNK